MAAASLLLILLVAPLWLRSALPQPSQAQQIRIERLDVPLAQRRLGPFRLAGAWQLTSRNSSFGGYSALIRPQPGRLLAISDGGYFLDFAEPTDAPVLAGLQSARMAPALAVAGLRKADRDVEAASWDPLSQQMWLALEGRNAVVRQGTDMVPRALRVIPEWAEWSGNTGPEAMTRLRDGRFVALCECYSGWTDQTGHPGFIFASDPTLGVAATRFTFAGAPGYRPTDMAQLPDGRLLVLMRRLLWPAPARFAAKLMLADPAAIRLNGVRGGVRGGVLAATELADLSAPLPVDNFEALAIELQPGGGLTAWLMSDDNAAVSQRTLLWRLDFRISDLPPMQKAPGSAGRL